MIDKLIELLKKRNRSVGNDKPFSVCKWTIAESKERDGKGIVASCNIEEGELIFMDLPILTGPTMSGGLIGCSVCLERSKPLRNCVNNCHLPVCSEKCEADESHRKECELLRKLDVKEEEWSPRLFKGLTLIRSLLMSPFDREIVKLLYTNVGPQVDLQVSNLLNLFRQQMSDEEQRWMKHCCGVMDGTAFRIMTRRKHSSKGLFPLSAVMNHDCCPNTRRIFADETYGYRMLVFATKRIAKGEEIVTNYCPILWDTDLRRSFLKQTKHFDCKCKRCSETSTP